MIVRRLGDWLNKFGADVRSLAGREEMVVTVETFTAHYPEWSEERITIQETIVERPSKKTLKIGLRKLAWISCIPTSK